jgi:hypothetical protein
VASFCQFHLRHGVACADLLTMMKSGGSRGSWRPFLAHLSTGADRRRKTIKLTPERRLPRALDPESVARMADSCQRLRDRFLIELLAGTGIRVGEALGLRHEDIDAAGTVIRIRKRHNSNGARVKGGQREIPVPPGLIRLYTDYLVEEYGDLDCEYVFVNLWGGEHGTPWRYWNVTDPERLRQRNAAHRRHEQAPAGRFTPSKRRARSTPKSPSPVSPALPASLDPGSTPNPTSSRTSDPLATPGPDPLARREEPIPVRVLATTPRTRPQPDQRTHPRQHPAPQTARSRSRPTSRQTRHPVKRPLSTTQNT